MSELTDDQKQRLREWREPQIGDVAHFDEGSGINAFLTGHGLPYLSIGQMIELLAEKHYMHINNVCIGKSWHIKIGHEDETDKVNAFSSDNLIYALWQAVKVAL